MPETVEYRVGAIEKKFEEHERRNNLAHEKFYGYDTNRQKFEAAVEQRCAIKHDTIKQLQDDNTEFKVFKGKVETTLQNIEKTLGEMAADVKVLNLKDGKKWENAMKTIVASVVSLIIGAIAGGLFIL